MHRASAFIQVVSEDNGHFTITKKAGNLASKSDSTEISKKPLRAISIEEVHAANTEQKAWVAIRGSVIILLE